MPGCVNFTFFGPFYDNMNIPKSSMCSHRKWSFYLSVNYLKEDLVILFALHPKSVLYVYVNSHEF